MHDLTFTPEIKSMDTVRFLIRRKAAFFGALLPHRIFINGQFAGMVRNGRQMLTTSRTMRAREMRSSMTMASRNTDS